MEFLGVFFFSLSVGFSRPYSEKSFRTHELDHFVALFQARGFGPPSHGWWRGMGHPKKAQRLWVHFIQMSGLTVEKMRVRGCGERSQGVAPKVKARTPVSWFAGWPLPLPSVGIKLSLLRGILNLSQFHTQGGGCANAG